jgi:hypothetical protein
VLSLGVLAVRRHVRYRIKTGKLLLTLRFTAFDPKRTLAVRCGKGFDAGFSPYQSTRLSR